LNSNTNYLNLVYSIAICYSILILTILLLITINYTITSKIFTSNSVFNSFYEIAIANINFLLFFSIQIDLLLIFVLTNALLVLVGYK
jgi:hypothetical protein